MNFQSSTGIEATRWSGSPMRLRSCAGLRQTSPMPFRSRGFRLLLAALLIFSQHQAVLHLLGHEVARLSAPQDPADPAEQVCVKCVAIAHVDHVIAGVVPALAALPFAPERVGSPLVFHLDLAFFASYRSRAPPVVS